jgi:hypothetical protein
MAWIFNTFNAWLGLPHTPWWVWPFTIWIGGLWALLGFLVLRWCDEHEAKRRARLRARDWTESRWWP